MPSRKSKFEISASPTPYDSDLEANYQNSLGTSSPSTSTSRGRPSRSSSSAGGNESIPSKEGLHTGTSVRTSSRGRGVTAATIHEHVVYDATNHHDESGGQRENESSVILAPTANRNLSKPSHRINYGTLMDGVPTPPPPPPQSGNGSQYPSSGIKIKRQESILRLTGMIDDRAGEYDKFRVPQEQLKKMSRKLRHFYSAQNNLLDGFAEVDEILDNVEAEAATGQLAPIVPKRPSQEREDEFANKVKLIINVNVAINIVLLAGKVAVVLLSNSMSLVASTVDSAMDLLSTMIIFGTSRVIEHRTWKSQYEWPTGKRRLEPVGVVAFSVFMIAAFIQVFIESIQRVFEKSSTAPVTIPLIGGIVMALTIAVKLVVWVWCRAVKNTSVEALAQDAENDIVFNFFSLVFPFMGQWLGWNKLDPIGGMVLSLYIIVEWTGTLLDNTAKLSGRRGSPDDHKRVAYLLSRFSPLITGIQHLSLYHAGEHLVVEADVILPHTTALTVAHNLGESAQFAIEQLEGVDRAFVHVDVTMNNLSGHLER
ncbi:BQ5605_C008g04917 [Microbotryum silenes-dioicae]|uniref:BQ5605_C008g04917 protein n=1 Tax=Microbotryum silenes-dioicae TaxID=796604 RepID=A0A2X0N5K6_9BASI|nr:BQ5605_C008g04917 [Microbotryum silenes-dioicae]